MFTKKRNVTFLLHFFKYFILYYIEIYILNIYIYGVIFLDNFNIDKNTMDKLNSMLSNGNIKDMLSQVPPDTINKLSNMMNTNTNQKGVNTSNINTSKNNDTNNPNFSDTVNSANNFDFSNIDMNTIMKMKSIMEKMNQTSDPRSNLLQSLRPYLRDEKKSKLDQYSKLLNMTSLMELFNQQDNMNNKENSSD